MCSCLIRNFKIILNCVLPGGKLPATCLYYQRFEHCHTLQRHQNIYLKVSKHFFCIKENLLFCIVQNLKKNFPLSYRTLRSLFGGSKSVDANRVSGIYELFLRRASESGSPGICCPCHTCLCVISDLVINLN